MKKKIGFIGAGNMGGALIHAVCGKVDPSEVEIFDINRQSADALSAKVGCVTAESGPDIVKNCEYVIMCVKPQYFEEVLAGVMPAFRQCHSGGERKVVVSIVAGYELSTMTKLFADAGIDMPLIRLMPNTPVMVGKGLILSANNKFATDADVEKLFDMLEKSGFCERTTETMLSTACPVFSCSPAFVYMFIEAIADGGVQIGVPRAQAIKYAAQAVLGAAAMVLETGKHPGELKDAVCSPGGITITGVTELEKNGFRSAAAQAVIRAFERQEEMTK